MTTITIDDKLIEEAKRFGWNEKTLTDEVSEFIRSKISLMQDNDEKIEEEVAMLNMILADDNRTKSVG